MATVEVLRRLVEIGIPPKMLVPVIEAFESNGTASSGKVKRRKRRTKAQMAADAAKEKNTPRKKRGRPSTRAGRAAAAAAA